MRAPEINNQQSEGSFSTEESERYYSNLENMNLCDHIDAVRYSIALLLSTPVPPPHWKKGGENYYPRNREYVINTYDNPQITPKDYEL